MNESNLKQIQWAGIIGIIGVVSFIALYIFWNLNSTGPDFEIHNANKLANNLASNFTLSLMRPILALPTFIATMIMFAGLRKLFNLIRKDLEWISTLMLFAIAMVWAVSLVADGLYGAAVLGTLYGNPEPVLVKTLIYAGMPLYNGPQQFICIAFTLGTASFLIFTTKALPKWLGWVGWIICIGNILIIPAIFVPAVDWEKPFNIAGWLPILVANIPLLIWIGIASVFLARLKKLPEAAQSLA